MIFRKIIYNQCNDIAQIVSFLILHRFGICEMIRRRDKCNGSSVKHSRVPPVAYSACSYRLYNFNSVRDRFRSISSQIHKNV